MPLKPKPVLRIADHIWFGPGQILSVRELDAGGGVFVADVKFEDATRTIRLLPEYWRSGILRLIPKRKRKALAKPSSVTVQVGAA